MRQNQAKLLVVGILLAGAVFAAPVPKEWKAEVCPPPPDPDETFFGSSSRSDYGIVVAVKETRVTLKPLPSILTTTELPNGETVKSLLPVDEAPHTHYVHPVMRNGGLADRAAGDKGYRTNDLKVGDIVSLHYITGKDKSRWLVEIAIHDRDKQGAPPPFRTHEQWREIQWERQFARQQRLKAEAEKKDKK